MRGYLIVTIQTLRASTSFKVTQEEGAILCFYPEEEGSSD